MNLIFEVQLEETGAVTEDDGESVWHATTVCFGCGDAGITGEVQVDGYSGNKKVAISRDDFGLPPRLTELLALAIYRSCGAAMRQHDCDFCTAACDAENLINRVFYHADAQALLRRIRATVVAMSQKAIVCNTL
jgi:hypothetical protein